MDRENARARRDAEQLAMGDDGAGHSVPCSSGFSRLPDGIERGGDRAAEIGMGGVDLRIDHGDQHARAGRDLVGFGEVQLGDRVLRGIAARQRGSCRGAGVRASCWSR